MKLTTKAIDAIKENTRFKTRLALAMDCSVFSVERWIKGNLDDLTKAKVLDMIMEETGLSMEEILDRTPEPETVKA